MEESVARKKKEVGKYMVAVVKMDSYLQDNVVIIFN